MGGAAGLIPVWRQSKSPHFLASAVLIVVVTAQEAIPGELTEFANIVHGLNRVLDLSNNEHGIFNIFWHPEDRDLMGFNRNRLIFLNLAHFTQRK